MLNAMNSFDKSNGQLTKEQIVQEIWTNTIGSFWNIWIQEQQGNGYKQPLDKTHSEDTKNYSKNLAKKPKHKKNE
jgi:hypothetical protein